MAGRPAGGSLRGRTPLAFGFHVALVLCLGGSAWLAPACRCQAAQPANPCENAMNTYDLSECWGNQFKLADAELNRVYREIMDRLPEAEKTKLRDAQRAWIPKKEKKGDEAAKEYEGGTFAPIAHIIALTEETQARTAELKKTYGQFLASDAPQPPKQVPVPSPPSPPKTVGSSPGVFGSWVSVSGPTDFESMDLVLEEGQRVFRSYLHDRPAWFGTWQTSGDRLTVKTEDGETMVWTVVSATGEKLVLHQEGETENSVFKKSR